MASVHDVAAYILKRKKTITAWKLQKLVYYSQAWSLVWDDQPLFRARIEAWANGPVVPALYSRHRGQYYVGPDWRWGDPDKLSKDQRETVDAVLKYYGPKSSHFLSDLTHQEAPWLEARNGVAPGQPSSREIGYAAMADYYSSL